MARGVSFHFLLSLIFEFFGAATNLSSSTPTGPDKVAYLMLKHLPHSAKDILHIFDLTGISISFLLSGRHLLLFISIIWESLSTLLLACGLSLSPPASQSFLNASFYFVYSFRCLFSIPLVTRQTLDQILSLSQSIWDGFNKLKLGSDDSHCDQLL